MAAAALLFYAHYDGQPVNPANWVGHGPFEPVLRDGRLEEGAKIIPFPADGKSRPTVVFGARGITSAQITVCGPTVRCTAALRELGPEPRPGARPPPGSM